MKNENDFLKILETFPGKEELQKRIPRRVEFSNLDFLKVSKKIRAEKPQLDLGENEDLWVRYIVLENFAMDDLVSRNLEGEIWDEEEILSPKSIKTSLRICHKFNQFLTGDAEVLAAAAIELDELHDFLQENNLF